jgi:hypothetical protein
VDRTKHGTLNGYFLLPGGNHLGCLARLAELLRLGGQAVPLL